MGKNKFEIKILDLYWIDGKKDNPDDLCLHGDVYLRIGDQILADKYSCTVSSTGLYLLKSLEKNHIIEESSNQMLPCCGHFIVPDKHTDIVEIVGCYTGIDWTVIHSENNIKLITPIGKQVFIEPMLYRDAVYFFVDQIENFYKKSTPKNLPEDDFNKDGYIKFWNEWRYRRSKDI